MIDERIKHVGVSRLRKLNTNSLSELADNILVLHDGAGPLAVLLSYEMFLRIQKEIAELERQVQGLQGKP